MIYPNLLLGFLRVGCFSFGGAYGAIPLIRDIVLSYGWLSDEELTYMIAVSESTPGPIMVNLATYIGSSQAGLSGAVLATLAVVLPSFLVILLITAVLKTLLKNRYLQAALGAGVVGFVLGRVTGKKPEKTEEAKQGLPLTIWPTVQSSQRRTQGENSGFPFCL